MPRHSSSPAFSSGFFLPWKHSGARLIKHKRTIEDQLQQHGEHRRLAETELDELALAAIGGGLDADDEVEEDDSIRRLHERPSRSMIPRPLRPSARPRRRLWPPSATRSPQFRPGNEVARPRCWK